MSGHRHPDWCARGHQCTAGRLPIGEHRADPIAVTVPGRGSVVLTRARQVDGREFAEVRLSIRLSGDEQHARWQLVTLLTRLNDLIAAPTGARAGSGSSAPRGVR